MRCQVVLCLCRVVSCCVVSRCVMSCSCRVVLSCAVSGCVVFALCWVVVCCVGLWYTVLCCGASFFVGRSCVVGGRGMRNTIL